jgi:hypothetical protein
LIHRIMLLEYGRLMRTLSDLFGDSQFNEGNFTSFFSFSTI